MGETQAAAPEPVGPETLGDPVLVEADELIQRINDQEERKDKRQDKNVLFKALEKTLGNVTDEISKEEAKEKPDAKKLARLYEKKASLSAKKTEIESRPDEATDERFKEVAVDMKEAAAETKSEIAEITRLRAQKAKLTEKLATATDEEKASLYGEMAEVDRELEKAEVQGSLEDKQKIFEARIAMGKKAEAMTEAEHAQQAELADKALAEWMNAPNEKTDAIADEASKDAEKAEEKKPAESKPAEEKDKERKVIISNKIDQVAHDLALALVGNKPKEDATYDKYMFEAKRGLLMALTFFGGNPEWTQNLTPEEHKTLGMTVTSESNDEGKTIYTIKWDKIDFSGESIQDVYEVAFGKDGWAKEMALLSPETKLSDLQARSDAIPADTQDPKEKQYKAFVEALIAAGATTDTLVQAFMKTNTDKIIKKLKPETEGAVAAPEDSPAPAEEVPSTLHPLQQTSFDFKADEGSSALLDEWGVSFTGSQLVDHTGQLIADFGTASNLELTKLENGTLNLVITSKEGEKQTVAFKDEYELKNNLTPELVAAN